MRRVLAALAVLVLAACGSDTAASSAEGKKYVDAMMASYRSGKATKAFTESEARCIVEHTVNSIGVSAFRNAGLTPKGLDHGAAFQVVGKRLPAAQSKKVAAGIAAGKCVNPGEVLLRTGIGDSTAFKRVPPAKLRCYLVKLGSTFGADRAFGDSLLALPGGDKKIRGVFLTPATTRAAGSKCKIDPKTIG